MLAMTAMGCASRGAGTQSEPDTLPDYMLADLNDEEPHVRHRTVLLLSGYPCRPAATALTEALGDPVPLVRGQAASSWGDIARYWRPDPPLKVQVVDMLCTFLAEDEPVVRRGAAYALGRGSLRDGRAVPFLIDALRDSDSRVRSEAAVSLGWIGDPVAIPALIACLREHLDDEKTTFSVRFALGFFGSAAIDRLEEEAREAGPELSSVIHTIIRSIRNRG